MLCDGELHHLCHDAFDNVSCTDETRELHDCQRARMGHAGLPRRQTAAQAAADTGPPVADLLRAQGHDVLESRQLGPDPGDRALLERATSEAGILVTIDTDFG